MCLQGSWPSTEPGIAPKHCRVWLSKPTVNKNQRGQSVMWRLQTWKPLGAGGPGWSFCSVNVCCTSKLSSPPCVSHSFFFFFWVEISQVSKTNRTKSNRKLSASDLCPGIWNCLIPLAGVWSQEGVWAEPEFKWWMSFTWGSGGLWTSYSLTQCLQGFLSLT